MLLYYLLGIFLVLGIYYLARKLGIGLPRIRPGRVLISVIMLSAIVLLILIK